MKPISILVIDDEPNNFDIIDEYLTLETVPNPQEYQFTLHFASSGIHAIHGLDTYQPDLILLDLVMPGLDGIAVCQKIKALPKWNSVPIIMVTGLNSFSTLAHCLDAGADDFISKPVNALELRARINSMLRIKDQYDSIHTLSSTQTNIIQCLENSLQVLQGNLVCTLAHELNTPVQGIVGMLDLLENYREQMSPEDISQILSTTKESTTRLDKLIKRILFYLDLEIKSRKGEFPPERETQLSYCNFLRIIAPLNQQHNRAQDVKISVEDGTAGIAPDYFSTLLEELVDNAMKFSEPNHEILVKSYLSDDQVHIAVQDQGRGMTPEQVSSIDAFIQFERDNYEQQGVGIGLKIVKKLLDMVGGSLRIQSEYKKSTHVLVSLPIEVTDKEARPFLSTKTPALKHS